MKRMVFVGLFAVLLLAGCLAEPANETVVAKFFTTEYCHQCNEERAFLYSMTDEYPWFNFTEYNVTNNTYNTELLENLSSDLGFSKHFFPIFVIGNNYQVGFDSPNASGTNIKVIAEQAYKRLTRPPKPPEPKQIEGPEEKVVLMLFWRDGCPRCQDEKEHLFPYLRQTYPELVIETYEVFSNESARQKFLDTADCVGFTPGSVPVTVVGEEYMIGYDSLETTGKEIEAMITRAYAAIGEGNQTCDVTDQNVVDIPGLGKVDLSEVSLPLFTMVLGLIDGFNPCAFFVLCFLLTLLIYAKSRAKILIVGLTFVFISGLVYFLFMSAWLNFFLFAGEIAFITTIGGIIAVALGVINFKEFFLLGKGKVSTTISEEHKSKLFARMRGLVKSAAMLEILAGTIILAIVANTYELFCTLGLPMIYTRTLTLHGLDTMSYYLYLALYNVFYILPLMTIVLIFAWTLGSKKLTQGTGELLKLISGFMMLGFGLALIFQPGLMSNLLYTLALIGCSVLVGYLIYRIKKRVKSGDDGAAKES
jgi:thiol-disulfide isomerase/thioredoxin